MLPCTQLELHPFLHNNHLSSPYVHALESKGICLAESHQTLIIALRKQELHYPVF